MKKTLLSLIAFGIFATSFAGTLAYHAMQDEKVWVYQNGDRTTNEPNCIGPNVTCATQYFLNEDNSLGEPTGEIRTGIRTN